MILLRLGLGGLSLLGFLLSGTGRLLLSLLGLLFLRGTALTLIAFGRGPEGEVVPEQLHDEGAVAVAFLRERVEFCNGIIECLLGKMASTVGGVKDLIVEDGEVQSETKADGVSGSEIGLGNVGSILFAQLVVVTVKERDGGKRKSEHAL